MGMVLIMTVAKPAARMGVRKGHVVLATADSEAFSSLRARPTARAERFAMGKALRQQVPREVPRALGAGADRPDPVAADHASPTRAGWTG